jgi:hypothetical protein
VSRHRENFMTALAGLEPETPRRAALLRRYVALWTGVLRDRDRMCLCGMMAADIATLPKAIRVEIKRFFDDNEAWLVRVIEEGRRRRRSGPRRRRGSRRGSSRWGSRGDARRPQLRRSPPLRGDRDRLLEGLGSSGS